MQVEGKMVNYVDNAGSGRGKSHCVAVWFLAPNLHASILDACCLFMIAFSALCPLAPPTRVSRPLWFYRYRFIPLLANDIYICAAAVDGALEPIKYKLLYSICI